MNDQEQRDTELPPAGFTPIDIFAPQPRRLRLAAPRPAHRRYRRVHTAQVAPVSRPAGQGAPLAGPGLPPAEEPDALFFHAAASLWAVTRIFALLEQWLPQLLAHADRAASLIYNAILLALPVARRALKGSAAAEKMRIRRPARGAGLLALLMGLGASLSGLGVCALWDRMLAALGAELPVGIPVSWRQAPLLLVTSALLPAVCEELFFRGYLLSAWEDRRGWGCVPVTAVLFTLLHGSLQGLPARLLMGLLLGFVCVRSGSVFVPVLAHFGYNAGMLLFSGAWGGGAWVQETALALCGAAVALVFFGLICRFSGRHEANSPLGRGVGWEGAAALYAGVATCVVACGWDALRLFGIV